MKAYFITFEGPDGAGKTTVINRLRDFFSQMTTQYIVTREPGGSQIAEEIRRVILSSANQQMAATTEALLFAASRGQHVQDVILPALKKGITVISDRYIDSSLAYQGVGRQLGIGPVQKINDFATKGLTPDLTLFLDLDPQKGLERIMQKRSNKEDRLDKEKLAFHQLVYQGYQEVIKEHSQRIRRINADQSVDQVVADCQKTILQALSK